MSVREDRFGSIVTISDNLARAAVIYGEGNGRESLGVGKNKSGTYDQISRPVFSPDGRHVYAVVETKPAGGDSRYSMLVDLRETDFYDRRPSDVVFSKDGRAAYFVEKSTGTATALGITLTTTKKALVVDGAVVGPWFSSFASDPIFDPTSRTAPAYLIHPREGWFVVSAKTSTPVRCHTDDRSIPTLAIDSTGRIFVFGKRNDGRACVEIDGVTDTTYDRVTTIQSDPISGALAYVGLRGGKAYVVASQGESGPYDRVVKLGVYGSAVWTAMRDGAALVATAAAEFALSDPGDTCIASPDGRHIGCIAPTGSSGQAAIVDGRTVATYSSTGLRPQWPYSIALDDAGLWFAYTMNDDSTAFVLVHDLRTGKTSRSPSYSGIRMLGRLGPRELQFATYRDRAVLRVRMLIP